MKIREFSCIIHILFAACLGLSTYSSIGQVIFVEDTVINPHTKIKINYDLFPGNPTDWISLARKDQSSDTYIQYFYLNSQKKGSLEFDGVTSGDYELRGYFNNEYTVRTRTALRIGNKDLNTLITPDKPVFKPSDSISVKFSGFPGNELDYIGISTPGSPANSLLEYKALNKQQSGSLSFSPRSFGIYELRGFFNNEQIIRTTTQLIVGDQTLSLEADKTVFASNEPITLKFSGFPGNEKDWISISSKGSPAGTYIDYKYLNGQNSGTLAFGPLPDGDYELRGYVNNEQVIRVIFPFKVGSGDTPGGNPLVSQIPGTINVQGVLSNSNGQTVQDGTYTITFRFYDLQVSGTVLWEERLDNLQIASGVFNAVLGTTKPFDLPFDKPYFLGIQPGGEPEMKPRIELTAVPYSLMAKTVEDNSISTEKIRPNAVTAEKIAPAIISGINGITNDGSNINIVAGANISIVNDDQTNSITISSVNPGGGGGGISRINPGTAISVSGQDGPTTTISVSPNSITGTEIQNNTIAADKIVPNVISSLSGVSNDGGNINLIAGNNISIVPNDANKTITISAAGGGTGTGSISQLIEGNGIGIQNPFGPNTTIGLKPNILLGPNGSLYVLNQNNTAVAGISANTNNQGGYLTTSNAQGIQMFGVTIFGDGQPGLTLNSRLGRQVIDIKANEFSDGEMNLKSVLGNTTIRLTANENAGGLINVFNSGGNIAAQLTTRPIGDGLLTLNNVANVRVVELRPNSGGGGLLRLNNEQGTEAIRLTTGINTLGGVVSVYNRLGNEVAFINTNNLGDGRMFLLTGANLPAMDLSTNVDNGGGYFSLSNGNGNEAFRMSTYLDRQPYFRMLNRLGNSSIDMLTNELGDGGIFIKSGENLPAVDLQVNQDNGGGFIGVLNGDGNGVVSISSYADRQPYLKLFNRLESKVAELTSNEFSDGELTLGSVAENITLRLTANENLGGQIDVFNQLAEPVVRMSTNTVGDGGLFLFSGLNVPVLDLSTNVNRGGFFTLRNQDATEVFRLSTLDDRQPIFLTKNRLGNEVAELMANEFSDGQFTLFSVLTNPTVRLTANDNAGGIINVFNQGGQTMAAILDNGNGGFIDILNNDGTEVITMGITTEDLNARIQVNNRLGNSSAELFSNQFSDGQLTLNSVLNNPTVIAGANDNAGGLINVFNRDGKRVARLTEVEGGFLGIFNTDETEMIQIGTLEDLNGLIRVNNRLGNPVADIQSNEFSDGQITLGSVLKNRTILLTANENAGGLINVFNKNSSISAQLTESEGDGLFKIFNRDSQLVHQLSINENRAGLFEIKSIYKNPENVVEMGGNEDDEGHLYLFNRDSKAAVYLSAAGGDGDLSLNDIDGKIKTSLSGSRYGGTLSIRNENNQPVHFMGSNGKTKEGFYSIFNKSDINKNRLSMGGDSLGNGYLNVFNFNGLNTFFMGHNQFADGMISIKNNMGNLGALFEALKDGGSVTVTDGKPGTNHRGVLLNGLNGGKLSLFNNQTKLVSVISVGDNGEGLWQIVSKQDITKNRIEMGGDNAGAGFARFLNGNAKKNSEIISNGAGGELNIFNTNGINTGKLGHWSNGSGALEIGTPNGNKVVRVTSSDGAGFIGVDNIDNMEVVRITANTGKGGGMALRNDKGIDMIHLTQNQSYGTVLVNNPSGLSLATITRNSANGGFIGTKDQFNKDALWLTTGSTGGGKLTLFNALGNAAGNLATDGSNNGLFTVHGAGGNEVARMETTTSGTGKVSIKNSSGINLAGITNHPTSGGGYVYVQDASGKELARMTTNQAGTNGRISVDNTSGLNLAGISGNSSTGGGILFANDATGNQIAAVTNTALGNGIAAVFNKTGTMLAGLTMSNNSGGGYLFANHSNGKDVARMSSLTGGSGYVSVDNPLEKTVSALGSNNLNSGYFVAANSAGSTRAFMTNFSSGGYFQASNTTDQSVIDIGVTSNNHGFIETSNSSGAVITNLSPNATSEGFVGVNNAAGQERGFMVGTTDGGQLGLRDNAGRRGVFLNGQGFLTLQDADGSWFTASHFGTGFSLGIVDKLSHPRAEMKEGYISMNGKNGQRHSFLGSTNGDNLGYIGVYNSQVFEGPVEAGLYVNASNQGVMFADVKNFKMAYPGKPDKQIWYGSLEGPELAAYIRGTGKLINGKASITFTDHYQKVANTGTMTVILTPLSGKSKGLAVVSKKSSGFEVEELLEGSGTYEFDWEVKCVRNGYEDFEVVRNKSDEPVPFTTKTEYPSRLESRSNDKIELDARIKEKLIRQQ